MKMFGSAEAALQAAQDKLRAGQSAVDDLRLARGLYPDHAGIALLLADALHHDRDFAAAIDAYHAGLRLDPSHADGWYGLGCAALTLHRYGEAETALARAQQGAPRSGAVAYNRAKTLFELGLVSEAVAQYEAAGRFDAGLRLMAEGSISCIIPGDPKADHAAVLRARRHWARAMMRGVQLLPPRQGRKAGKIRLGYMSGFFAARHWMKPMWGMINHHDRAEFELYFFADGAMPSAAAGYRAHDEDRICDMRGVDNARTAEIIRELDIDILIDLNGYSYQERLPVIMAKPAPVVVAEFSLYAASGIDAYDVVVGDATVIKPVESRYYSERIHPLPVSYLAFEVPYAVPAVVPPPGLANGFITFGCFCSQYKITGQVLETWSRILAAAPVARLVVKNAALEDASTRAHLTARMAKLGIDPARVTLRGRDEHYDFIAAYAQVDIALDVFPYNGGTTTMEALWQGVPVLSFDGDRWAGRTSKSLLVAAGMPEWVRHDREDYTDRAIALANDPATPAMLAALRGGLREKLRGSRACDTLTMCRELEQAYRSWHAGGLRHRIETRRDF